MKATPGKAKNTSLSASDSLLSPDARHHTSDYYFRYYKAYYQSKFNAGLLFRTNAAVSPREADSEKAIGSETRGAALAERPIQLIKPAPSPDMHPTSPEPRSEAAASDTSSVLTATPFFFSTEEKNFYASADAGDGRLAAHAISTSQSPRTTPVIVAGAWCAPIVQPLPPPKQSETSPTRELFPPPIAALSPTAAAAVTGAAACERAQGMSSPRRPSRRAAVANHTALPELQCHEGFTCCRFNDSSSPSSSLTSSPPPSPHATAAVFTAVDTTVPTAGPLYRTPLLRPPMHVLPAATLSAPSPSRRHEDRAPNALGYTERKKGLHLCCGTDTTRRVK